MPRLMRLALVQLCLLALSGVSSFAQSSGSSAPEFFRIQPVRPVEQLRHEALLLKPPPERGDFKPFDLVELIKLDPSIHLDIRYASSNNFLGTPIYSQARAFLQRPAAAALVRAAQRLKKDGFGLLIHDGYRPWYVTWMFWQATPPDKHDFVADPAKGSRHNRGCAVDLTLYDLHTGRAVEMPGLYDEMTERSYPNYTGGTPAQRHLRDTLRAAMESEGFRVFEFEWWHFDYQDWQSYPIGNISFESIGSH
jgi:D-alanyl-D-alanine dipeptidase